MLKTLIVLPDGTELFSGTGTANAIQSVTITKCVNGAQELSLGSCCANMVETKVITPNGALSVAAGDEITVYRVAEDGSRAKVGLFTTEKPTRPSANSMRITAYDRISWLDEDLSLWLASLDGWPYALYDFAQLVCSTCGLALVNTELPNGDYPVQKFSAQGITGRQLVQWIGEIAGCFCRATPDGDVELAWYTPADLSLGPAQAQKAQVQYADGDLDIQEESAAVTWADGSLSVTSDYLALTGDGEGNGTLAVSDALSQQYYFQDGLSFEDYTVAPIEKVQLRQNEEDIGTVWPEIAEEVNTYIISGNYLLTAASGEDLKPVAQTLYERLAGVSYTPCRVSIPTGSGIDAGNTVRITDRNGRTFTAYVMSRTQSGQKDTLECTGSARRDSSTAVNDRTLQALSGKVLNLRTDVDGLKLENRDMEGRAASLELDLEGIRSQVSSQETVAQGMQQQLTLLAQTADEVKVSVQSIQENGAGKVTTETGYTFDADGLRIRKSGQQMENLLDNTGMYVKRAGEIILQANDHGVVATDVTVRNYLSVGNSRFEDYTDGTDSNRTACFYVGV